mmetsp:Transcript_27720/g.75170  ORF Transcript_27720/g.75170 Transcript_27720/m.75170 type:complete len:285 (-) Transcript_27720:66-920(-)
MGRGNQADSGIEQGTLQAQPFWAQKLLEKKKEETVEQEETRGVRPTGPITSRLDLIHLVHQGNGAGLLVDAALAEAYPSCRRDIASLITEGLVRHVLRRGEGGSAFRRAAPDMDPRNQQPAVHRLRAAVVAVGGVPWLNHLSRVERQGPGGIAFEDFVTVVRSRGRLSMQLVSDEDLRTVFRLVAPELSTRAGMKELVGFLEEDEQAPFPQNMALFPRLEREAELVRIDDDVREAFHAVPPVNPADLGIKITPKQEAAPKAQVRRTCNRKRKFQNTHMFGSEPL